MCLAVPGIIESVREGEGALRFGRVRFGTAARDVCLEMTPDAGLGDWVIVHVGFAISKLDERAARETIALLSEEPAR